MPVLLGWLIEKVNTMSRFEEPSRSRSWSSCGACGKIFIYSSQVSTRVGFLPAQGYSFGDRGIPTRHVDSGSFAPPLAMQKLSCLRDFSSVTHTFSVCCGTTHPTAVWMNRNTMTVAAAVKVFQGVLGVAIWSSSESVIDCSSTDRNMNGKVSCHCNFLHFVPMEGRARDWQLGQVETIALAWSLEILN